MEKIFSFELWLANNQGHIMCKVFANYPGTNSFVALLNLLQGMAREKRVVKSLNDFEIYRLHVSEIPRDSRGYELGQFRVTDGEKERGEI